MTCEERASPTPRRRRRTRQVSGVGCREGACSVPVTLLKTENASSQASWRRLFAQETSEQHVPISAKRRGESALQHGDDVIVKASGENAEWLIQKFKEWDETTTQMIGEAADLNKQIQILNRTVRWSSRGLWTEADPHCKRGDQSFGARRCQSSLFARSSGQGGDQGR